MRRGDRFYIEHLGGKLAYQVDSIKVITPDRVDELYLVPDKDYVTLLTCTPYMINSHRLLVSCLLYTSSDKDAKYLFVESKTPEDKVVTGAIAVPFVLTLPAANSNGEGYYDTINVYPKNTTGDKPKVDKDVTKLGNDDDSYEVGKEITWFLKSTIPENLKTLTTFKLTDTLSCLLYTSKGH